MDNQSKNVRQKYDLNKHLINKIWTDDTKGLHKEVICFRYCTVVKPSELSKCLIEIIEIHNLNAENYPTKYLKEENIGKEFWIEIGHSLTPVDCYIEEFLRQMFTNETSKCTIATKSGVEISFTMSLKKIEFGGYFCEQSASKMFDLAKLYKDNGVNMFKEYPFFAHNYFNLAAKCLLSFNPFDDIRDVLTDCQLTRKDFEGLLQIIYLNIAACLLKQKRYDDILHVLNYINEQKEPSEKAVFRLATAHFHLQQFEKAKVTIERINYKNNKALAELMVNVQESWKVDQSKYSNMVKKMFA